MTGETNRKMQKTAPAKAKDLRYGNIELVTVVLMGLVLAALVLAALTAPTTAHAERPHSPTVHVMTSGLPQDFSTRLDASGLSLMGFERLVNLGVELIEVKSFSPTTEIGTLSRLEAVFPEIDFERIDE